MMKKKMKVGLALLLATVVALPALRGLDIQAADAVQVNAFCSVEFSVAGEFTDLATTPVEINLYKVASIDVSGNYTAEGNFANLDVTALDENTDATAWETRAQQASAMVPEGELADASGTTENGELELDNLGTGLYLVEAATVTADYYRYTFSPYLISLPNNYYYTTNDDQWVYDLTGSNALSLKPEQEILLGDLVIDKTLNDFNVTFGEQTSFVYEVTITTLRDETETRNYMISFTAAGNKTLTIADIPAGSRVEVRESYDGAGYHPVGESAEIQETIVSARETGDVGTVFFTNESDGSIIGGYGVVNNYQPSDDGDYRVEQQDESQSQVPAN